MNRFIVILIIFLGHTGIIAQPGAGNGRFGQDQRRGALEARRIAWFTQQMELSPEEAKVFWPLYREYQEKSESISQSHREWLESMPEVRNMSEAQATLFAEREVQRLEKAAALRREYHEQFCKVLPVKKLALLYEAEKNFNRMLFRESQQQQPMRGRGRQ